MAAQTAPTEPPIDHLIVKLKTLTATRAMAAIDNGTRLDAVIQRSLTRWTAPVAGSARAYASTVGQTPVNVQVERTISNGATVLSLGQRMAATDAAALAQAFAADSDVDYAEPDHPMQIRDTPSDPLYSQQWYLSDPTAGINLPPAWSATRFADRRHGRARHGLPAARRPRRQHPLRLQLHQQRQHQQQRLTRSPDATDPGDWVTQQELDNANGPYYHCASQPSDSSWHGTRVMGVIGATANNGTGIAGVSWLGQILPVRVLGKCGGTTSDIADGMRWAAGIAVNGVPNNPRPRRSST